MPRQETVLSRSVPWHPEGGVTLALLASGLLIAWLCEGAFESQKAFKDCQALLKYTRMAAQEGDYPGLTRLQLTAIA